jgi:hypothetical protein
LAGGGGLYAFDVAKGQPIPAKGIVTYEVTAPGYEPLSVQREVAYDDNASGASHVQHFSLVTLAAAAPLEFSGSGQQATQLFPLSEGLVIFHMTHTGDRNFAIWLLDDRGRRIDLLVNEIGPFNGSTAIGVQAGSYLLDISADGAWAVSIEQPYPATAPPVPQTFTGQGQQVSPMFALQQGLVRFAMSHNGDRNFAIWLLDQRGNRIDLLVNEIGQFSGSKAIGITRAGIYLLDIAADGNWTVTVEQ